jgi:hypothetical protein
MLFDMLEAFISVVRPFLIHDVVILTADCSANISGNIGLTAYVTGQQGMLTPKRHLIPLLVYSRVCVIPVLRTVKNNNKNKKKKKKKTKNKQTKQQKKK